jgi:hypothetical protein
MAAVPLVMPRIKNLDLSLEFADLRDGVEGVLRIARGLRDPGALSPGDRAQTTEVLLVLVRLLSDRLQALAAAARGEVDPTQLVNEGNRAAPGPVGAVLRGWSSARRLAQAVGEVERLRRVERGRG